MDINLEYIKMCEKAKKIQRLRTVGEPWKLGDWFVWGRYNRYNIEVAGDNSNWEYTMLIREENSIWLPRQDQLQEMMRLDAITLAQLLADYVIGHKLDPAKLPHPSMEQLWLVFVMKERYNKVWNGEDWVVHS